VLSPVIQNDFYDLCSAFFDHILCLQSINGSYITLTPKVDSPTKISDFTPISLLNSVIKFSDKDPSKQILECHSEDNSSKPIWVSQKPKHSRLFGMGL
jgi:hypothetical protein